jgi:hypothetical protein
MTRYLQRLVAHLPGVHASSNAEVRPLVPSTRTPRGAASGEPGDPFEGIVSPSAQAHASLVSEPHPPATHQQLKQRKKGATLRPTPVPIETTIPAPLHPPTPPIARPREPGSRPSALSTTPHGIAQPASHLTSAPARVTKLSAMRPASDELPAPDLPTSITRPAGPPAVQKSDTPSSMSTGAELEVHETHRMNKKPKPTDQILTPQPPALPTRMPAAEKERAMERSIPTLRPPEPAPAPPMTKTPEQPRVVIGRLTVEVVPAPPATPRAATVRRTQPQSPRTSSTPSHSEPTRSKLRFGLGQM